jgi:amino acid adenylation domain-containing protein
MPDNIISLLPLPYAEPLQTIHGRFESIAASAPNQTAVSDNNKSFTFKELDKKSNDLAQILMQKFSGRENVAVYHENSVWQVVSILGILKAGKTYVPLDASFPDERNQAIMNDAGVHRILTETRLAEAHPEFLNRANYICSDELSDAPDADPLRSTISPDEAAILLYTSGSTGKPKGVVQTHENMVHFIKRLTSFSGIQPGYRFAHYLSPGFSAHALPLLASLLNGGQLELFNVRSAGYAAFSQWFAEKQINAALVIPSFLRHWMDAVEAGQKFPDLRLLLLGGETLYRGDVEKARKVFGRHTTMFNILASTEAYLSRGFEIGHDTPLLTNIVPVGYPVEGVDLLIRNAEGGLCNAGETGEIYLSSRYISTGYWNNPEQTQADVSRDTADPRTRILRTYDIGMIRADGCVVHLGRKDTMVKLRGYRIDLAEVESVLLGEPEVKEAVCGIKTNRFGTEHIVAWIVGSAAQIPDLNFLKAKAAKVLPDYMVPTYFVQLTEMPRNSSGKTDRASMPEPDWARLDGHLTNEPPADDTERQLVRLFEKSLNLSPIGVTDNFLELGADSLRLFVAINNIEKHFRIRITADQMMELPTIRQLARLIESTSAT